MTTRVRDWMSKPVIVVDRDCSVSYALTLMRRRNIHSVVVGIDEVNSTYGIITTTDIRDKIVLGDLNPAETRVKDIMTAPVLTANPDWSLKECSMVMHKHNIHHMPVSDEHGVLVGIISATDIFMAAEETGWGKAS